MKRILLYSPDVVGHPRVYVRVIADALAGQDCLLVAAMGFTDAYGLHNSPDLHPLKARPGMQLVDTRTFSRSGRPNLTAEEIGQLQESFGIDTTLFIEADKSNGEFRRIAAGEAPRLRSRNIGVFANTAEWHPGEDSFTGEPKRLIAPTVRTTAGNLKRAIFERKQTARYFFESVIVRAGVLDALLVKDERLAQWRGPPVVWMPEFSRPPDGPETESEQREYEVHSAAIRNFLSGRPDLEPILYFGDAAFYKGYDLFLEFAAATPSVCVIHAGLPCSPQEKARLSARVDQLRGRLHSEGRLHETNAYVSSNRLKRFLFEIIRVYITTHRLALSSSTMIQAAEAGRPVLMPDRGLIGHRIRVHNLGATYRYGDIDDLQRAARLLWESDLSRFRAPMLEFWSRFSDQAVQAFFSGLLLGDEVRPSPLGQTFATVQ